MNGPEDNTGKEAEAYGVVLKLLFLGLAAGFATLLIGWIVGSLYAILAFAVAVWVAAMKSIEKELIDKTAADRVYYSVAIFFVALFFIFNSPVRIKHGLQVRYNSIQQIVVDTGNTLAFLQSAAVKPEEFLAATRLAILDARQLVSGHCQSVLTPPLPRGEPTNPLGDPLDRCLANPLLVRSVDAQKLSTLIRSIDDVWMHRKDIHDVPIPIDPAQYGGILAV